MARAAAESPSSRAEPGNTAQRNAQICRRLRRFGCACTTVRNKSSDSPQQHERTLKITPCLLHTADPDQRNTQAALSLH